MKPINARTAMGIAGGMISLGWAMAAGLYYYHSLQDDTPAPTEEPEEVITITAADECAVQVVEQITLPSLANLTAEYRVAVENGLSVPAQYTAARIEGIAEYKINQCEESTGTELTDEVAAAQMQRVEAARSAFIEEFTP